MTGEKIKNTRQKLGLNQREFAELIGTGKDVISRWESGKVKISKAYQKIIEALNQSNK